MRLLQNRGDLMSKITIYVNDHELQVDPNQTIFEAAKKAGIIIQTFCNDERLHPEAYSSVCIA